jgi:hypothetical protein
MNYIPAIFFLVVGASVIGSHYGYNFIPYFDGLSMLTGWIFVLLGVYFLFAKVLNKGLAKMHRKQYPHPRDEEMQ